MRVHDLTALLETHMATWATSPPPVFEPTAIIARDGYSIERVDCFSHTGTHVDAPYHFLEDGATVDAIPPEAFVGRAAVLDLRSDLHGTVIDEATLRAHWPAAPVEIALLETGWSHRRAATKEYLYDFPGLSPGAARFAGERLRKGLGTDTLSIDPFASTDYAAHKVLLRRGLWLAEALDHLDTLREGIEYTLVVAPLKIRHGSGGMARVFALEGDGSPP